MKLLYAVLLLIMCSLYSTEMVTFNTQEVVFYEPIESLQNASNTELLAEPSMKQATFDFAWEVGGPITRDALTRFKEILGDEYQRMRIDTKIQAFNKNEFSNTPGWHCDFFSTTDLQEDRLVRLNPGLEKDTRIFLLISGEPATEFMVPRELPLDIDAPTWKAISDYIDSFISDDDLYRIPAASPVELKGNELHRVTLYEGDEPTVRYFMRVYLFPEGHSQEGVYKNELFDWETFSTTSEFLDKAFSHLNAAGVDVTQYEMTHLCYRTATEQDFLHKKEELAKSGTLISDILADGRPYLVYKLHKPIVYQHHSVDLIALPYPKPNNTYKTGWQHLAFLMKDDIATLLDVYPEIAFDTLELNRASHPEIKLHFEDLVVKFHNVSLEDLASIAP